MAVGGKQKCGGGKKVGDNCKVEKTTTYGKYKCKGVFDNMCKCKPCDDAHMPSAGGGTGGGKTKLIASLRELWK